MEVFLEKMTSLKLGWLAMRQSAIAANIANANTPAFKAQDVTPFSAVFDKTALDLVLTSAEHLSIDENQTVGRMSDERNPWEITDSGNSVSLENELMKSGSVNQEYKLTTNIIKAFDSMFSSAIK